MICTDNMGQKCYMTNIIFKELVLVPEGKQFVAPKSICLISTKPVFEAQRQILQLIFERVVLNNNSKSIEAVGG